MLHINNKYFIQFPLINCRL